jgi:DnaK suppressor protein
MSKTTAADGSGRLTAGQLSTLRERLLAEQTRLRSYESTLNPVREAQERSADAMDEAEASLAQHEALGRSAHDRTHLREVEKALAKIEAGSYGKSELSGEAIGYERLNAVPWARFTAAEQEDLEFAARG